MQRLQRYILGQLFGPFAFFLAALTGVIWLSQSLRYVDLIINKGLSAGFFGYMTVLILPSVFNIILPISLFAAVLYTYNKLSADSEIVVMRSAGLSNFALAWPAVMLGAICTVIGFLLSLYLMPAGQRELKETMTTLRTNLSHVLLQEGSFNTIGDHLTVYIRARQPGGAMQGILVHDNRDRDRPVTMMAESGALVSTEHGPRFVLVNGNRQQVDHAAGQLSLLHFDRYTLDLSQFVQPREQRWLKPGERFLHELFWPGDSPDDLANAARMRAEGHDRLAAPFYNLAFVLLALAAVLSGQYSRRGQGWRIVVAILGVVLIRALGLGLANAAAKVPLFLPLIHLHIIVAIAACLFLLYWRGRRSERRAAAAAAAALSEVG